MERKLHLLDTYKVRGDDGRPYVVHGYEHLARLDGQAGDELGWQPTGQIEYRLESATQWQKWPDSPGTATVVYLQGLKDGRRYIVRARWRNGFGARGDWRVKDVLVAPGPVAGTLTRYGEDDQLSPTNATAGIKFRTDGTIQVTSSSALGAYVASGDWFQPTTSGIGSSYWVRADLVSGNTLSSGTLGAWQQLTSDRKWEIATVANGQKETFLTISVAASAGGGGQIGSWSARLFANRAP